ncbi:hypothetical protein Agub_g9296, partial [Astrephomene gubernaculifera]
MEPAGAAPSGDVSPEQRHEREIKDARERTRLLREKLVFRCKDLNKWKFFVPASVEVPPEPAKAEAEKTLFNIITGCLYDPTTLIPLEVQALHKKILADPAGERYEAALSCLGLSSPEPLIHKLASISFKFGAHEFSCLKIGQLAFADGVRMYVTRVDRPALTRLTGIEDPERLKQQQQGQQQPPGQGGPQQQQQQQQSGGGQPGQQGPPQPQQQPHMMMGGGPQGPMGQGGPGAGVPGPAGGLGMGMGMMT